MIQFAAVMFLPIALIGYLASSAGATVITSVPLYDDGDGQLECHVTNTNNDVTKTVTIKSIGLVRAGGSGSVGNNDCGSLPVALAGRDRCRAQSVGLCTVDPCYCRIDFKGRAAKNVRAVLMKRDTSGAITAVVELRKKLP